MVTSAMFDPKVRRVQNNSGGARRAVANPGADHFATLPARERKSVVKSARQKDDDSRDFCIVDNGSVRKIHADAFSVSVPVQIIVPYCSDSEILAIIISMQGKTDFPNLLLQSKAIFGRTECYPKSRCVRADFTRCLKTRSPKTTTRSYP